jgi:sucrose-6-phosphate hydrolase SacC (GH32 family)
MSWGHARSTDLVHWEELPVAIQEDPAYMIFSGSIVVVVTSVFPTLVSVYAPGCVFAFFAR